MSSKSIIDQPHAFGIRTPLDHTFKSVATPYGLKNIELFPHQSTIVAALLELEDKRVLQIQYDPEVPTHHKVIIETSAIVLAEPFGSGKTIEILAMILYRPVPRAYPTHVNSIVLGSAGSGIFRGRDGAHIVNIGPTGPFIHEITRIFTGQKALIRPNLIIVGSSVLIQWRTAIETFTNLKLFTIGGVRELKDFQRLYESGAINHFDIVLLKNGMITGNFILPDEDPKTIKDYRSLIPVINKITAKSCWSRVFYDDFDTISIPKDSKAINALFSVYVSATTKTDIQDNKPSIQYKSIIDAFRESGPQLGLVTTDKPLFTTFNVRNKKEYVELSTSVPIIEGRKYVYNNPDDNYMKLLGAMGEADAQQLVEMLNGDAKKTAAQFLGIVSNSVADIFQRMLDNKYERYLYDKNVLELLTKFKSDTIPRLVNHPDDKKHSMAELDNIRATLIKKTMPIVTYYSVPLSRLIDDMIKEFRIAEEQDGIAIQRVKDNIKEGGCQVCKLSPEDYEKFNVFIVRCCGIIVCDECCMSANNIGTRYDYKLKTSIVSGQCANCKTTIYPHKDLIFVDKDFDMSGLLTAKGDEKPIEEVVPEPAAEDNTKKIENPKLKALFDIASGQIPEGCEHIKIKIDHLLDGVKDMPRSPEMKRKLLVFANYSETLNLIENFLTEYGIEFLRLHGTAQEKADIISKFRESTATILLINSQQQCAGMNLEFATDIVYFHKIIDQNIESQVAGRAQRIGRTCNLMIHYLAYTNESMFIK